MAKPVQKEEKKEGRKPDFVVRARQGPGSEYFQTLGAAWRVEIAGEEGVSVRLHSLPCNQWDGSFLLMVPKDRDE